MKFRKRAIEVEAVRFTKDTAREIAMFLGENFVGKTNSTITVRNDLHGSFLRVRLGEWIVKGDAGDFYPCDNEVFEKTYEPVEGVKDAIQKQSTSQVDVRQQTEDGKKVVQTHQVNKETP